MWAQGAVAAGAQVGAAAALAGTERPGAVPSTKMREKMSFSQRIQLSANIPFLFLSFTVLFKSK